MNDAQALEILKQFIDQAIGQGLFKSYEMATTAVAAVEQLRMTVQGRSSPTIKTATGVGETAQATGKKK